MSFIFLFYNFLTGVLVLPVAVGFLFSERGRERLYERLGLLNLPEKEEYIWFHGASAGEIKGLTPLFDFAKSLMQDSVRVLVTVTSPTALKKLESDSLVGRLMPFDNILLYFFAFRKVKIKRVIIGETELWPGMLWFCRIKKIPIFLVNARISELTERRYGKLAWFFRPLLEDVKVCCVDTKCSAEHFKTMGIKEENIYISGNSKYDQVPRVKPGEEVKLKKQFFAKDLPVITLGSIRPDEEQNWFNAFQHVGLEDRLNIVVAPRHQEKFEFFREKLEEYNLPYTTYSDSVAKGEPCKTPVLLLDTFGQLENCYSFSDLAFIGATLVKIGGHNPLEASQYGVPIIIGPHHFVVREIVRDLIDLDGGIVIDEGTDPGPFVSMVAEGNEVLKAMGGQGIVVCDKHRGAVERVKEIFKVKFVEAT